MDVAVDIATDGDTGTRDTSLSIGMSVGIGISTYY